jgi:hypothetical protein
VIGAVRPLSSTGTKSIAYDVPNMVVPWLGTRLAGLFCVRQRPENGYSKSMEASRRGIAAHVQSELPVLAG